MEITEIAAGFGVGGGNLGGGGSENPFLDLIVAELQNQNPLEPVSNTDYLAQLAQFSTLEQMEALNANLSQQNAFNQFGTASNLVGKDVDYLSETGEPLRGRVDSIVIQGGRVFAEIGEFAVPFEAVVRVYSSPAGGDGASPPADGEDANETDVDSDER